MRELTHDGLETVGVFSVSGGMLLLFPISWQEYQLGWIHSDDYSVALILLFLAAITFVLQNREIEKPGMRK